MPECCVPMLPKIYASRVGRIESAGGGNLRICLIELVNGREQSAGEVILPACELADMIMKGVAAMAILGIATTIKGLPIFDLLH